MFDAFSFHPAFPMSSNHIRNVAIIAHVDHGKTTLVDQLLRQGGAFRENQVVSERIMDSMDLEKEKGITIKAKNTAILHEECLVNIVDTPGHADFGAEVERVMKMVDGVILLVDAYEGPQAQTRFVLRKALEAGLSPVIVINKVDRENSRPEYVHDKVLELFLELEATDEQFNAPFLYASARDGWATLQLDEPRETMAPLFKVIRDSIPAPVVEEGPFRMLVSNIDYNDFVGRIAVGRVLSGSVKQGQTIYALRDGIKPRRGKITKLFTYTGITTEDSPEGVAGDIVGLAGFEDIGIGDTLAFDQEAETLPFVAIDPPTIQMEFSVNDGPFAGREGKKVTSRQIRERLIRETQSNISIRIEDGIEGGSFLVTARGAMQISVLLETMRREGFEILVSRPTVVYREEDGKTLEPFERLWIELPDGELGGILDMINRRKGLVVNMDHHHSGVTIEAEIPTRGIIGLETDLVNLTSGTGVLSHLFLEYRPTVGPIDLRLTGTLVSMVQGSVMAYALDNLQQRGRLFVAPGEEVYGGQIVGENPRKNDLPVNPTKAKQLDNIRSSGDGKGIMLTPPVRFTLEKSLEYIAPDELVEVTPLSLRLRKRLLNENDRRKAEKKSGS